MGKLRKDYKRCKKVLKKVPVKGAGKKFEKHMVKDCTLDVDAGAKLKKMRTRFVRTLCSKILQSARDSKKYRAKAMKGLKWCSPKKVLYPSWLHGSPNSRNWCRKPRTLRLM